MMRDVLIIPGVILASTLGAMAQEAEAPPAIIGTEAPGLDVAQAEDEDAPREGFTLSYGAAITSNYISDGATQSNDNPALQGYVEGAYDIFYGGVWSSTVDFNDDPDYGDDNLEFDLYAGVRPSFGGFDFDLSYYRYLYDSSGDCCGEFQAVASHAVGETGELSIEFDYDPESYDQWGELGGSIGFLDVWSASFAIGTDFGSAGDEGADKVAANAGITRSIGENAYIDVRYSDSNYDPETVFATLGVDF